MASLRYARAALLIAVAAWAWCGTAAAENLQAAREGLRRGEYSESLVRLGAVLADPAYTPEERAEALGLKVDILTETGRYKEALQVAGRLARVAGQEVETARRRARVMTELGKYEAAARELTQARRRDPDHHMLRLEILLLAEQTGDRRTFNDQVDFFFDSYNTDKAQSAPQLTAVARAVQHEDPHGAWGVYGDAHKIDADYLPAYLFEGFLAHEKYHWGEARKAFQKVLEVNPHHPRALTGMAAVHLANGEFDDAVKLADQALETNPHQAMALELKATMLSLNREFDASRELVGRLLQTNPKSITGHALMAAHHDISGNTDARDQAIARAQKVNPHDIEVFLTLARSAEHRRQFSQAVDWAQRAIRKDPNHWEGYYLAGMNLLRSGEEKEGYRLLEESWKLNAFNVWTFNTLKVMDKDFRKHEYVDFDTPHFRVKLHQTEADVLWPYLEHFTATAWREFTRKYKVVPSGAEELDGRILLSMFPTHEDFSARTVGLPGLPALGACFGQTVFMPSPRFAESRPGGQFNWRRVFEHEFLHVLTLQKTGFNIPRWLTEGISTYEEQDPQIKLDPLLVWAVENDKLLPLKDLEKGFYRPQFATQIPLCYYHASLIVRHIIEDYGMDTLLEILELYRQGGDDRSVLEAALGKSLEEFDAEQAAYVRQWAQQIHRRPMVDDEGYQKLLVASDAGTLSADDQAELAAAHADRGRMPLAHAAARAALQKDADQPLAHALLGFLAMHENDLQTAEDHFRTAIKADPDYAMAHLRLGLLMEELGRTDDAIKHFEAVRRIYPRLQDAGESPHHRLATLYLGKGQRDKAIAALQEVVRINNLDYDAFVRLGRLLAEAGRHAEAAEMFLQAFCVNPFEEAVHLDAAKAYEEANDLAQAEREYRIAAILSEYRNIPALEGWARTAQKNSNASAAREAVRSLRRVDPWNPVAEEVEKALDR